VRGGGYVERGGEVAPHAQLNLLASVSFLSQDLLTLCGVAEQSRHAVAAAINGLHRAPGPAPLPPSTPRDPVSFPGRRRGDFMTGFFPNPSPLPLGCLGVSRVPFLPFSFHFSWSRKYREECLGLEHVTKGGYRSGVNNLGGRRAKKNVIFLKQMAVARAVNLR